MRIGRLVVIAASLVTWTTIAPATVLGHSELRSADPPPNATLVAPPERFRLDFSEPVDPDTLLFAVRHRGSAEPVALAAPVIEDDGRRVSLAAPRLEPGVYEVEYRAVSVTDGHVIAGKYAFQIDPAGTAPPLTEAPVSGSINAGLPTVLARWVALAAALALFGTAVFWLVSGRPALRELGVETHRLGVWRLLTAAAFLAFGGLGVFLGFAAAGLSTGSGEAPHEHFALDFAGPFGWTPFAIAMRVVEITTFTALLIASAWFTAREDFRRNAAKPATEAVTGRRWTTEDLALGGILALGALALSGFSFGGHAASLGGTVSAVVDWLHLLAVGVWLGTLPALLLYLLVYARGGARGGRAPLAVAALRRHSRLALVAGPAVALTGVANSSLVLGSTRDLVSTDYGNLLAAKLVLFSAAIALGAANFFLLRAGRPARVTRLVGAEAAIGLAAILVAAGLVTLVPPGGSTRQTTAATQPAHLVARADAALLHAVVTPGDQRTHVVDLAVLEPASGAYLTEIEGVSLLVRSTASRDPATLPVEATESPRQPGLFRATVAAPAASGEWLLDVSVERAGRRPASATFEIPPAEGSSARPAGQATSQPPGLLLAIASRALPVGWGIAIAAASGGLILACLVLAHRVPSTAIGWRRMLSAIRTAAVGSGVAACLLVGAQVFVGAANAAPAEAAALANPVEADAGSVARGRQSYLANCAACHGTDGAGDGPLAGELVRPPGSLASAIGGRSDGELHHTITNGLAGIEMPAFDTVLNDLERWDLVNYLRNGLAR